MIQRRWFAAVAAVLALSVAPAIQADEKKCSFTYVSNPCVFQAMISACQSACQNAALCFGQTCYEAEDCCEVPMLSQIPCLGPMFKVGKGSSGKAENCKCCKDCADSKTGECCCSKKPKTLTIGAAIGCGVSAGCGMPRKNTTSTTKRFTVGVQAQPCVMEPKVVYNAVPPPVWACPPAYAQPCPTVTQATMPYVISERASYVIAQPIQIRVAKSEPDAEVRKVEWRTQSDFLSKAGHLEIQNGGTTVCCEKMVMKTAACGSIKVCCDGGQVAIDGPSLKGKADHISSDHQGCLVLTGNVRVSCEKDGQSVAVQGSHCTVHVSDGKISVQMK